MHKCTHITKVRECLLSSRKRITIEKLVTHFIKPPPHPQFADKVDTYPLLVRSNQCDVVWQGL